MAFHWYIDIEESPASGAKTFSAGPIAMEPDEDVTVTSLVDRINTVFLNIYQNGGHDNLYTMSAKLEPISPVGEISNDNEINLAAVNNHYDLVRSNQQFIVHYRIENTLSR